MPPTPRPSRPLAPHERAATCLETDEEVLSALRANLGTPPGGAVTPVLSPQPTPAIPVKTPPAAQPARPAAQPWSVTPYRPTLRPPIAVLTVFDDGKADGEQFRLRDNRFVIGRTEGDLVIPHDGMISGRHV